VIRVKFKGPQVDATQGIHPEIFRALAAAAEVWEQNGAPELVVTSLDDGEHRPDSKHYKGDAADLRIWNLPRARWHAATNDLAARIGDDFDVVLEKDHVHVEWDPGT